MKNLLFAVLALLIASCSKEPACTTTSPASGLDITVQQQVTRSLTSATKRLTCLLTDADGIVAQQSQTSTDSDYGTMHFNVPRGDYNLLIYASSATDYTVGDDALITLGRRNDSFSYHTPVSVQSTQRTAVQPTLTRCVSQLIIQSQDDVPADAAKIQVQLTGTSSVYDISQGIGADSVGYDTGKVSISAANSAHDGTMKLVLYQFIPDTEKAITATLTIYNSSDEQLYQVSKAVTLKQNVRTTLTGAVFHANGTDATISINEAWGTDEQTEI